MMPTCLPTCLPAEAELDTLNTKLTSARTKATEARQKLTDLEAEQTKLQDRLDGSYGQDDAYVALVGRCIEAKVGQSWFRCCFCRGSLAGCSRKMPLAVRSCHLLGLPPFLLILLLTRLSWLLLPSFSLQAGGEVHVRSVPL